jgi:hypothetical protein
MSSIMRITGARLASRNLAFVNAIDWCTSIKLQVLDMLKGARRKPWTGMEDPEMAFGKFDPKAQRRGLPATSTAMFSASTPRLGSSSGEPRLPTESSASDHVFGGRQPVRRRGGRDEVPIWRVPSQSSRVVVFALP